MGSAIPGWLTPVAWTYITLALIATAVIAADIYLGRRRHPDTASELVWITTGLYLGPFAIPVYVSRGRTSVSTGSTVTATHTTAHTDADKTDAAVVAVLPGGGASAVAHLVAVPFVAAIGWTIAGMAMWPMIFVIAVLVTVMLFVHERLAGRSAGRTRLTAGAAVFAAVATVAAFDIGMVGWMLLLYVNDAMPEVSDATFWFLMQVGVLVGLATGYPAVKWLLSRNQSVVPA
ncbi:DUF4396 domain-containing protein [Nocardioides rubriscoriae]|uniref:DUF4396 domain-containing protein n=1 Tax=Nocardioides rubriscoriae TaxID=642762 RepID=UPI0014791698|nr:DUF4396 domain-containing protein [Nocardioides rubriscoriae]